MGTLDITNSFGLDGSKVKEHQRQNMWLMNFDDFPGFDLYITDSSIPLFKLSSEKVPTMDLIVPMGKEDYSSISLTFLETVDFQGFKYHTDWLDKLYDFNRKLVRKTFHTSKKSAVVKFISMNNVKVGVKDEVQSIPKVYQNLEIDLKGIQLLGIDDISLQNDSGDPLTITVNYEIQQIIPVYGRKSIT